MSTSLARMAKVLTRPIYLITDLLDEKVIWSVGRSQKNYLMESIYIQFYYLRKKYANIKRFL